MKKILFILAAFIIACSPVFAQENPDSPLGMIVVNMSGFRNDNGNARVFLFRTAAGFPDDAHKAYEVTTSQIKNGKAVAFFEFTPYGDYAISMFHDEDSDGVMDTNWYGKPMEGYGISGDAKGYRADNFSGAKFTLDKNMMNINIETGYSF